jgi:hypothetical protein
MAAFGFFGYSFAVSFEDTVGFSTRTLAYP